MTSSKSVLLACTVLTVAVMPPASAASMQQPFAVAQVIAQAPAPLTPAEKAAQEKKQREERKKHKGPPPSAKPAAPPPAAQQKPATPPPTVRQRPAAPPPPAVQHRPVAPPRPPAAQHQPPAPPAHPAAQAKPVAPPPPAAAQVKPAAPPPPAAAQVKPVAPPAIRDNKHGRDRRNADRKPDAKPTAGAKPSAPPPTAAEKPVAPAPAPTAAQKPVAPAPTAAQKPAAPTAAAPKPAAPPAPTARAPQPAIPAAAAPPPPTKIESANQFIQRKGQKPSGGMEALRKERRTTTDGNRTVIREGNRTIVRDGNRATIHHNEADRFAVGARNVKVDKRGDQTISLVVRPNGISIVSTTDRDGHLLRRVRRDRNGRDIVIIDNGFAGAQRGDYYVDVPPPRYRGPRDRYILDAGRANRNRIFGIMLAPPIEHLERRYTLDQVRYSEPLRQYMPRIDLDINFASGSWQLSPGQVDELAAIAEGINRAVDKNPREVFLIEGHTDAVGANEDNLSLSDRRAEAVAIALTEEFQVPPENLVTQGYGEEYLKVPTQGPARENRRVAVRRITPLIDQVAGR